MKKLSIFIAAVVCSLLLSIDAFAQAPADYFVGKWKVLTTGLPSGDATSTLFLERKEGKLVGTLDQEGKPNKNVFRKVEEKENSVTCYFSANGYDVYLFLEKKDSNNVIGSMMDMFDCTGVRIVEEKAKVATE